MLIALAHSAGATLFTAQECSDYMSARFHPFQFLRKTIYRISDRAAANDQLPTKTLR